MFQLVGLISLYIVSQPWRYAWRDWEALRIEAVLATANGQPGELEGTLKLLDALRPTSIVPAALSGIAIFVGFVLPVIELVLKR